ncbi:MAG TPA: hypothetical protein VG100_03855, partial [Xanthobacteraceae bacterium]|nr:hypothetical protein [Xanthobacteraceae bacterium]
KNPIAALGLAAGRTLANNIAAPLGPRGAGEFEHIHKLRAVAGWIASRPRLEQRDRGVEDIALVGWPSRCRRMAAAGRTLRGLAAPSGARLGLGSASPSSLATSIAHDRGIVRNLRPLRESIARA